MPCKIITDELKDEIKNYYCSKPIGFKQLVDKYNLCIPTISKILKDIPRWDKHLVYNPELIEDYFENIDTEIKAYFIGLMIADGNIFSPTDGCSLFTSITLQKSDKYLLEKFKSELHANNSLSSDGRGCYTMAIRSNRLANSLSQYGIVPRKTLNTYLPTNIPDIFMRHVFRGILDGDGNIYVKTLNNNFIYRISYCDTYTLMYDMSNYLFNKLALSHCSKIYDYQDRNLSEFKLQGFSDVNKFFNWIYSDINIFLIRKYEKYILFKNLIKERKINTEINSDIAQGSESL